MITIEEVQSVARKYQAYKYSLNQGQASLEEVIKAGTILFTDEDLTQLFPTAIVAYKNYLISVQTAINSFVESFPVEPELKNS